MTLGLTPTLGLIGAIIRIRLNIAIFFSSASSFLCFVSSALYGELIIWEKNECQWLTTSMDINCVFARCFGSREQLLGDLVADVTEESYNETLIPRQLLCVVLHSRSPHLFSSSFIALVTMTSFLHLSISFTTMICGCPSVLLPRSVGVLEKEAYIAQAYTRNGKDTKP